MGPPARRSPLLVVFLTVFLDLVGFGIVIPLLPFYAESFLLDRPERMQAFLVGVVLASYSLMQFLFAPFWGRLSDRIGRRPVILVSVAGSAVSMLVFGLANSYWTLLAARVFAGIAGANIAVAHAYVADVTTPETRAKGMGAIGAAFGLGFIFGPAIGGFFGQWGFATPAFVAAGLAAVNLVLAFFLLPESRPRGAAASVAGERGILRDLRRLREFLDRPVVLGLILLGFLNTAAFASMEATFGLWTGRTHGFDQVQTGYLFAYLGVVITIVQGGLVGPLARRVGERAMLAAGLTGMAIALALIPTALNLPALMAVMGLLAAANGLATPSLSALTSLAASAGEQGGVLGLKQSLGALARVVGPLWGGFTFGALGIGYPFWTAAGVMAAALGIAALLFARLKGGARPETGPARS